MATTFQLYQDDMEGYAPSSSVFDMISSSQNDLEPKQTKALAYMFAAEEQLLHAFLKNLMGYKKKELSQLNFEIKAESFLRSQPQEHKKRADIVIIGRDKYNTAQWGIVIEAKSMNRDISDPAEVKAQVLRYAEQLEARTPCPFRKVILTKNIDKTLGDGIETICWSDVINLVGTVKSTDHLYRDFYNFMIGANRKMHFYEQEVLAIPCGRTYDFVKENHVYVCPNKRSYHHQKSLYLAFIQPGGIMSELFKLKAQYTLPPDIDRIEEIAIPQDDKTRILDYFKSLQKQENKAWIRKFHASDDEYADGAVVYVLSATDIIQLPPGTKTQNTIRRSAYFKLADMLNPEKAPHLIPATQAEE